MNFQICLLVFLLFKEFHGRWGSEGGHKVRITKLSGKGSSSPQGPVCLTTEERVKYVHIFIRIRNYHFLKVCLMERFLDFSFSSTSPHRNCFHVFFVSGSFFISGKSCKREVSKFFMNLSILSVK